MYLYFAILLEVQVTRLPNEGLNFQYQAFKIYLRLKSVSGYLQAH